VDENGRLIESCVPEIDSRLLMYFIPYSDKWKRKKGRLIILLRVLQDQVSDQAPLSEWIDTARDVKLWNDIIDQWHEIACQLSFTVISDTLE
jgi:hypothetical protein